MVGNKLNRALNKKKTLCALIIWALNLGPSTEVSLLASALVAKQFFLPVDVPPVNERTPRRFIPFGNMWVKNDSLYTVGHLYVLIYVHLHTVFWIHQRFCLPSCVCAPVVCLFSGFLFPQSVAWEIEVPRNKQWPQSGTDRGAWLMICIWMWLEKFKKSCLVADIVFNVFSILNMRRNMTRARLLQRVLMGQVRIHFGFILDKWLDENLFIWWVETTDYVCLDVLATVRNEEGPVIVSGPLACFREFHMQIDQETLT